MPGIQQGTSAKGFVLSPFAIFMLCSTVAASILWPRYAYLPIGGLPAVTMNFLAVAGSCAIITLAFAVDPKFRFLVSRNITNAQAFIIVATLYYAWRMWCDIIGLTPGPSMMGTFRDGTDILSAAFIGIVITNDDRCVKWLIRTLVICTIIASALGFYEFIEKKAIISVIGLGIEGTVGNSFLSYLLYAGVRDGEFRARSLFNHPIVFGQYTACMLPIMIYAVRTEKAVMFRLMALAAFVMCFPALYVSNTRSAVVAGALGLVVYFGLFGLENLKKGGIGLIVGAVCAVALAVIGLLFADTVSQYIAGRTSAEVSSTSTRTIMFARADAALRISPIAGYGEGQSPYLAGIIGPLDNVSIDNYYISVAVDFGFIGLIMFIMMLVSPSIKGVHQLLYGRLSQDRILLTQSLVAGTIPIVISMYIVSIYDAMTYFFLFCGMLFGQNYGPSAVSAHVRFPRRVRVRLPREDYVPSANNIPSTRG